MNERSRQKIYNFYEIFNDFNRIRILINLNSTEKTLEEISKETGLKEAIVLTQLSYMNSYRIISQIESENKILFKISDKIMVKIVNDIIKYINKV